MTDEKHERSAALNENPSLIYIAKLKTVQGEADRCYATQIEGCRELMAYLEKGGVLTVSDLDSLVEIATSTGKYGLGKRFATNVVIEAIHTGHDLTLGQMKSLVRMARNCDHTDRLKFLMDKLRQAVHSTHPVNALIQIACGNTGVPEVQAICGFVESHDKKHIVRGAVVGLVRRVSKGIIEREDADVFIREIGKGSLQAALALSDMVNHGLNLTEGQIMDLRGIGQSGIDGVGRMAIAIADSAESRKPVIDDRPVKLPIIRAPRQREPPRIARTT